MKKVQSSKNADADLKAMRQRLQEAEDTLEAIRSGQVEALVVASPAGPRVYALQGADHRYRRLVETMNEGALLVSPSGVILYCNAAFATLVGWPLEAIVSRSLIDFVEAQSRASFAALLGAARAGPSTEELALTAATGLSIPVHLSMSPDSGDDAGSGISVIATSLAAQKRSEEIIASERLARSILEQAEEAIIVCDPNGCIIRASRAARALAGDSSLRRSIFEVLPLIPDGADPAPHPVRRALDGELVRSTEMTLKVGTGESLHLLSTAAPLLNERGAILGCVMTITDITRQKRGEKERVFLLDAERAARSAAERARLQAEESNRSKDEFLATVSHELRTPLNAIVGWSRLMSDPTMPDERRKHGIEVIRRNADLQARLVEDLLDVSRIVSGQMRLDVQHVEPARLLTSVIDSLRPALDAKEIRLETVLDSNDATLLGDQTRLQQVVWNLLSNAVKFTPRGGRIRISLRRVDSAVELVISDNGQGIKADFLPYVFDRFRQADGGIARGHGGLGLGLAISRHLVELHGGKIEVASAGLGSGATFTVRLPGAALRQSARGAGSGRAQAAATPPGTAFEGADLAGVNVFVVEDDDDSRDMLISLLAKCGANPSGARSGSEALTVLRSQVPDVLVSDIGMADMDGYSLIRGVRALGTSEARRLPALALTAYARSEDRRRALAEGFQMHLAKPVDPDEFVLAVASLASFSAMAR